MIDPLNLVDGYQRLWKSESPPALESYLTGVGPVDPDHLSRLARIDLSQRWHRGERMLVESYLERFPALAANDELSLDLIYHEYLVRDKRGD